MKKILILAAVCIALTGCLEGNDGKDGSNGGQGPVGPPGEIGREGPAGHNGTNGANGAAGINGSPGVNGAPGANGTDGTDGTDGMDTPHFWPMLLKGVWLVNVLNPDDGTLCTQQLLFSDLNDAVTNEGPFQGDMNSEYTSLSYVIDDLFTIGDLKGKYRIETNPVDEIYAQITMQYPQAPSSSSSGHIDCLGMVKTSKTVTYQFSFMHPNDNPTASDYYNPNQVRVTELRATSPPREVGTFFRLKINGGTEQLEVSF